MKKKVNKWEFMTNYEKNKFSVFKAFCFCCLV